MSSYSPSPSPYDVYSPSPWLSTAHNIPAHLLRPTHHPHQYHHTPLSTSLSSDLLHASLPSSMRHSPTMPLRKERATVVLSQYRYAGGYELGPVIGVGTYGEVRYGRSIDGSNQGEEDEDGARRFPTLLPNASVAIKLIDLARFTDETATLMRKEILILQLLHHRHVVRLYDVKEDVAYTGEWCDHCACTQLRRSTSSPGQCANCSHSSSDHTQEETRPVMMIVQELAIAGELFGLLMHTGPFQEDMARYYFRQLIEGLEHCHALGVVHRDLKPENAVLDHHYNLKIIDFGLAAVECSVPDDEYGDVVHRDVASLARSRSHSRGPGDDDGSLLAPHPYQFSGVGSCPYSAPEVFYISSLYNNRPYRGCSADVWSCAIILFVMLLGRPPFMRPLAKTYGSNMRRCRHFVSVMKGEGFGGMSSGAKDLLMKMMKMVPSERCTLQEIKEDPWYQGPLPSEEDVKRQMEERSKDVYRKLEKTEMIGLMESVKKEEQMQRQQMEDLDREKRARDSEGDSGAAPQTPVSNSQPHGSDTFPSLSPSSASSRSVHLPPHTGFSFHSTTRKDSESEAELALVYPRVPSYPSDQLTVSMLTLNDEPTIAPTIQPRPMAISAFGRLDPASSSPTSVRMLSGSSASPGSSSSSPSPPPSSVMSPAYPWAFR